MYKVLAVDDREIFLVELKRLKLWGDRLDFQITDTASNGKEALELLNKNSYDIVLTDIRMPVIDGIQLLREIQNEGLCTCVVILSEYSEFNYARQGIVLGAFDYIVKPATEETINALLDRTKVFLDNYYKPKKEWPNSNIKLVENDEQWIYPVADEKQIIKCLFNKDKNTIELFRNTAENIYVLLSDNLIKADIVVKKLYHNIITEVFEKFGWLNNYIDIEFFETTNYMNIVSDNNFIEFYCERIYYIFDFLRRFHLENSQGIIKEICEYILNNPSADLKLKAIAEKFYINNTYLSNNFATKTGVGFNDYVTMVRLARARYLLVNTKLKNYEIGSQIGYHDINYFSKLFKKEYGKNPSEYRNTAV